MYVMAQRRVEGSSAAIACLHLQQSCERAFVSVSGRRGSAKPCWPALASWSVRVESQPAATTTSLAGARKTLAEEGRAMSIRSCDYRSENAWRWSAAGAVRELLRAIAARLGAIRRARIEGRWRRAVLRTLRTLDQRTLRDICAPPAHIASMIDQSALVAGHGWSLVRRTADQSGVWEERHAALAAVRVEPVDRAADKPGCARQAERLR